MSARVAPDPVGSALAAAGNSSRAPQGYVVSGGAGQSSGAPQQHASTAPKVADFLPSLPLPPDPPGTNFAAAVMAGALPPKPTTPQEAFMRLGSAWRPPSSQFHLLDRVA